jgi:transcriptional regulator with XRE-family HTH domain
MKSLGSKIRVQREKQKISQDQLAYECETHRSVISRIENGHFNVTVITLTKIANALNVTLGDLLDSK